MSFLAQIVVPGGAALTGPDSAPATTRSVLEDLHALANNHVRNWLALLVFIAAGMVLGRVLTFLLLLLAKRLEKRGWHSQAEVFAGLAAPLSLAIFTLAMWMGLNQDQLNIGEFAMSPLLTDLTRRTILMLYTISLFWYAFNLVSVIEVALKKVTARTHTTLDDDLVPVIRKSLRVFIVVVGLLFILQNVFDRDIGAWLAGLGIAGLAVSLAAQDSLKNLFGSITILFDRPFTKGQRIVFKEFDGTVEEIGFRSTKIRTFNGSLVTIPNSNIVNDPVENWAVRAKIRRLLNVTITYDTPPAKVREAVAIIRGMFASDEFKGPIHDRDPVANTDPPRVFFDEFNAESLNIKVLYWYRPADYWAYLDFTERFNLTLMEAFEKAGIVFAFPTRTVLLGNDSERPVQIELHTTQSESGAEGSAKKQ